MKKYIPHIITATNLFFGCCAVVSVLYGGFVEAFVFLFLGGLCDFADGFVARLLNVRSELGKELDSLADMVSFGVVPGAILFTLLNDGTPTTIGDETLDELAIGLPGFLLTVFAGIRLAKFNLDTRQTEEFIGLPTPSATMFVTGLMLIYHFDTFGGRELVSNTYFLYGVIILFSFLLISEIPMFSLKFKGGQWKGNEVRYIFMLLAVGMLPFLREASFSILIVLYVLFSFGKWMRSSGSAQH